MGTNAMNETKASDVASVAVAMDGKFDHLTEDMATHAPKCKAKSPETCQYVLKEAAAEMEKPENKGKSKEEIIKQVAAQHEKFKAEGQARAAGGAPKDVKSDPNVRTQFDEAKKIVDSLPDAQKAEGQKIIQQMENEAARQNAQNTQNGAAQGGTDAAKNDAAATGGEQSADGAQNNGTAAQSGNTAQSAQPSDEERYAALLQRHATPKKEDKIAREKKYVMSKMESFRKEQEEKGTPEWKIQEGEDKIWAEHQERLNQIEQDFAGSDSGEEGAEKNGSTGATAEGGTDGGADGGTDGGTDSTASAETNTAENTSAEGSTGETGTAETTTAEGGTDGSTAETSTDTTTAEGSTAEGGTDGSSAETTTAETSTAETTTASTGTESGTTTEGSTSSSTSTEGGSTSTTEGSTSSSTTTSTAPEEKIIEKDGKKYLDISHLSFFPAMFRALKEGWKGNVNGIIYDRKAYLDKKKREAEEATKRGETAETTPAEKAKGMALFKAFNIDPDKMSEERRKDLEDIAKDYESQDSKVRDKARSRFAKALRDYASIDKMTGADGGKKKGGDDLYDDSSSSDTDTSSGESTETSSTESGGTETTTAETSTSSGGTEGETNSGEETASTTSGTEGGSTAETGTSAETSTDSGSGGNWKPEHQPHEDPVAEGTSAEEHAKVCKANPKSNCPFLKAHMSKEQLAALDGGSSDAGSSSSGSTSSGSTDTGTSGGTSSGSEGGGTSGSTTTATTQKKDRSTLHKEMMDASSAYNDLVQKKESGDTSITDEQVNAAMQKWDEATEAYRNFGKEPKAENADAGSGGDGSASGTATAEGTAEGSGSTATEGATSTEGTAENAETTQPPKEFKPFDTNNAVFEATSKKTESPADYGNIEERKENINKALAQIGIMSEVSDVKKGPCSSVYEVPLGDGEDSEKIKKQIGLINQYLGYATDKDTGMFKQTVSVSTDGRNVLIHVPNVKSEVSGIKKLMENDKYRKFCQNAKLGCGLGFDNNGDPITLELNGAHTLIGGASSMGKSVLLNTLITTIRAQKSPDELQMWYIDPKGGAEMGGYADDPHTKDVAKDPESSRKMLSDLVDEMERRNKLFDEYRTAVKKDTGVEPSIKNIDEYIDEGGPESMPRIVCVIDELAAVTGGDKEAQEKLTLLLNKARSVGISLVCATQKPSKSQLGIDTTNFVNRVALPTPGDATASQLILGTSKTGAANNRKKGQIIVIGGGKEQSGQGTWTMNEDIEEVSRWAKQHERQTKDDVFQELQLPKRRPSVIEKRLGMFLPDGIGHEYDDDLREILGKKSKSAQKKAMAKIIEEATQKIEAQKAEHRAKQSEGFRQKRMEGAVARRRERKAAEAKNAAATATSTSTEEPKKTTAEPKKQEPAKPTGGESSTTTAQTSTATAQTKTAPAQKPEATKPTATKPAPKRTDGDIGLKDSEKLQPSERLQAGETASGSTAQTATATEQKKAAPQPAKPKKRKWTKQEISQQAETNKKLSQQLIDMVKSVHGGARESVKKGRKYRALKAKRDEGFARMKAMNDGVEYVPQGTPTTDSASPHELIASIVRATAKFRERDLAGKLTVKARIARTLHRRNPDEPIV